MTFDKKTYYREYNKKYYSDPERKRKRNEKQNERRKLNPERTLYNKAKSRAKELGRTFTIALEDIQIPTACPILDIPLFHGTGKVCNNSPVLDRIDNALGYVKGNVCVISHRANLLKSDLSLAQIRKLLYYMEETRMSEDTGHRPTDEGWTDIEDGGTTFIEGWGGTR